MGYWLLVTGGLAIEVDVGRGGGAFVCGED